MSTHVSKYSDTGLIRCARRRVAVASGGTSLAGCSLLFCFVLPTDQPPGIGCGGVSLIIYSSSTMIKQRIDESGDHQSIHDPLPLSIRSAGPSWMPCMHDALRTGPVQCRGVYIHTVFERCKRRAPPRRPAAGVLGSLTSLLVRIIRTPYTVCHVRYGSEYPCHCRPSSL